MTRAWHIMRIFGTASSRQNAEKCLSYGVDDCPAKELVE
jgi:hypothetical protein